ncbi:putative nuclease HARBI1 [Vanessa cardui]|uniref:putative nuclease HARBI1 n=1 Tax=Vanessa cardui TaxID=171605 RepID=UPI001F130B0C|nr:putative nuclease HARBI1 [Vanessa cardui]
MHTLNMLWCAHNEEVWLRRQKRDKNRQCMENIREMPATLFVQQFRLDKTTFQALCHELRHKTSLKGTKEIPLNVKVLCTLSFLATGSYQRIVGVSQHLAQRTASRCIRQVIDALNHSAIMEKWIKFPKTQQDRAYIKQEFQRRFGLPGVIGCIDCTHIALVKPNHEEHLFYNRKGYHSLNVQMVCDSNLLILNVNAKFGGATHDSHIWSSSRVELYMRELHQNNEQVWLLGDSGYPQRPWLMTPILNAVEGSREHRYTQLHVQARNCIERCFGLLKARWRCLLRDRVLHYHPRVASKITMACCVLHNIALQAGLPPPQPLPAALDNGDDTLMQDPTSTVFVGSQSEVIQGRAMLSCLLNRI